MADGPPDVEEECKRLCEDILRISGGEKTVTFGALNSDEQVEDHYEALFGTLKAAKKRHYLTFEGELLLMPKNADDVITLLDNEVVSEDKAEEERSAKELLGEIDAVIDRGEVAPGAEDGEDVPAAPAAVATEALKYLKPVESGTSGAEQQEEEERTEDSPPEPEQQAPTEPPEEEEQQTEASPPEPEQQAPTESPEDPQETEAPPPAAPAPAEAPDEPEATDVPTEETQTKNEDHAPPSADPPQEKTPNETAAATKADSEAVDKNSPAKWGQVETSYIDHRTADPDRRSARADSGVGEGEVISVSAATQRDKDGKWKVDASYIDHRTNDPNRMAVRKESVVGASGVGPAPSASAKKESDGKWKVDTSYIAHRTTHNENLRREEEAAQASGAASFADPSAKKYKYDEIRTNTGAARPKDVDPGKKEQYLESGEFAEVFGMSPEEFTKLPKWKQQNLKKQKDLF